MHSSIPQIGATIVIDGRTFVRQDENPTFADIVKNPQQWADAIAAEYAPWDTHGKFNRAADMVKDALDTVSDLDYLEATKDEITTVVRAMRGTNYASKRRCQLLMNTSLLMIQDARAGRQTDVHANLHADQPARDFWSSVEQATA